MSENSHNCRPPSPHKAHRRKSQGRCVRCPRSRYAPDTPPPLPEILPEAACRPVSRQALKISAKSTIRCLQIPESCLPAHLLTHPGPLHHLPFLRRLLRLPHRRPVLSARCLIRSGLRHFPADPRPVLRRFPTYSRPVRQLPYPRPYP